LVFRKIARGRSRRRAHHLIPPSTRCASGRRGGSEVRRRRNVSADRAMKSSVYGPCARATIRVTSTGARARCRTSSSCARGPARRGRTSRSPSRSAVRRRGRRVVTRFERRIRTPLRAPWPT
jgi:hypothetical protein